MLEDGKLLTFLNSQLHTDHALHDGLFDILAPLLPVFLLEVAKFKWLDHAQRFLNKDEIIHFWAVT
jgi:hypothetical protein